MLAVFVAHVKQELQAEADAQTWLSRPNRLAKRTAQPGPLQLGHRVSKCPDTGQHNLRGLAHTSGSELIRALAPTASIAF